MLAYLEKWDSFQQRASLLLHAMSRPRLGVHSLQLAASPVFHSRSRFPKTPFVDQHTDLRRPLQAAQHQTTNLFLPCSMLLATGRHQPQLCVPYEVSAKSLQSGFYELLGCPPLLPFKPQLISLFISKLKSSSTSKARLVGWMGLFNRKSLFSDPVWKAFVIFVR